MSDVAVTEREVPERVASSERAFLGVSAFVFVLSTAVTIVWCWSMSSMGDMEMPGGWTMSMAWMRMPDQTWFGAAATFLGMWVCDDGGHDAAVLGPHAAALSPRRS